MTEQEEIYAEERKFAYNESLDDALEVLDRQLKGAKDELVRAKRSVYASQEDRDIARREISVIGELKSEIEKLKRTS